MAVPEAAAVVLDFVVTNVAPKDPGTAGKVKRDVKEVCTAFKVLVSEYSVIGSDEACLCRSRRDLDKLCRGIT
jgi:hypothetical protein